MRPLLDAGWTPGAAVFWRMALASIVLAPLGIATMRGRWEELRAEWRTVVGFGVLAVAVAQYMYFAAVSLISVGVALLLEYLAPVALVMLAWIRTRRVPTRLVLVGTALSVLGLFGVLDFSGTKLDPLGVVYGLLAMVGAAGYFVLGAKPSNLPAIALPVFGLPVGAVILGALTFSGVLPYAAPLTEVRLLTWTLPWWIPLGVVVLVATVIAYTVGVAGIAMMGERLSSFVSLSEVLFAGLLASVLLAEIPTALQLFGGAAIIIGVVLIRLASGRHPAGIPSLADELDALHPNP